MMLVLLSVAQVRSEDARSFAKRFYHAHREWGIRGVPSSSDMQRVSPYLDDGILSCFRQVNVQRVKWFREFNRKRIDYPQA